jgi:8-hydroxy-5-deazaflavin:NADPH oxidoreductase
MNIGVLGTGMVGSAIGTRLVQLGHQVRMGSRSADNPKAAAWVAATGGGASQGTFQDAAAEADMIVNCTQGAATLDVLGSIGEDTLGDKILIDISNPLDFSRGMPPSLFVSNTTSLAEQIQHTYPRARIVKALNTVNATIMVHPERLGEDHEVFVSGNDAGAKAAVSTLLTSFGWKRIVDLGDITTARGTEAYLLLWIRLWQTLGTADFNVRLVRASG